MGKTTLFPAQQKHFIFFYLKALGKREGLASNFRPRAVGLCGGHRSAINLAFALYVYGSRYLYNVNKTVSYSTPAVKNKVYKNVTLHPF